METLGNEQELKVTFASNNLADKAVQKGLASRPTPEQVETYREQGGRELDPDETLIVLSSAMQVNLGAWMAFEKLVKAK